jgi:pimeloyl-ACP methyl ester carboxylesterase
MEATRALLLLLSVASVGRPQAPTPLPPAPGRLIDVGGRKLHLLCSGQGDPTVVLEAGASSFAIDWTLVQREVSRTNRTCSYDRAGSGWSDEATPETRASSAADLHKLMATAGEKAPFVLVGASRGGLLIRAYLLDYPQDVIGLVFVDPASEDRLFTMLNGEGCAHRRADRRTTPHNFPNAFSADPAAQAANRGAFRQAAAGPL